MIIQTFMCLCMYKKERELDDYSAGVDIAQNGSRIVLLVESVVVD